MYVNFGKPVRHSYFTGHQKLVTVTLYKNDLICLSKVSDKQIEKETENETIKCYFIKSCLFGTVYWTLDLTDFFPFKPKFLFWVKKNFKEPIMVPNYEILGAQH